MELKIEAVVENIEKVTDFVNEQLEELGCSMQMQLQVDVALDEIFSNICNYAYDPEDVGMAAIDVVDNPEDGSVEIIIRDRGIPFDPLKKEDPDVSLGVKERAIGGLGIFMVKKMMDNIKYEYRDGANVLTITKLK